MNSQIIANGDFIAARNFRRSIEMQLRYLLQILFWCTLIWAAMAVVQIVLSIAMRNILGESHSLLWEIKDTLSIFYYGWFPWMLPVLGIVTPFEIRKQMSFGLTRQQFNLSMFVGAAIASAFIMAINAAVSAFSGSFSVESTVLNFLVFILCWHYGWIVAMGFQFRHTHFLCAVAGIAVTSLLATFTFSYFFEKHIVFGADDDFINPLSVLFTGRYVSDATVIPILLAETAILAVALQWLSRRVPVKCG